MYKELYKRGLAFSISWVIPNVFFENLHSEAYWQTQVKPFGPRALYAPHLLGYCTTFTKTTTGSKTTFAFMSGNTFMAMAVQPRYHKILMPRKSSLVALEARYKSEMYNQIKNDLVQVEMRIAGWNTKNDRHVQLNNAERLDFNLNQELINESRKRGPNSSAQVLQNRHNLQFALRTSRFPYIRCQANFCLGVNPVTGDKAERRKYLRVAGREANQLLAKHPTDIFVADFVRQVKDAFLANAAEP